MKMNGKTCYLKPLAEEHEIPYFDCTDSKNWPENEHHSFLEGAYKSCPYTKLRELYCTSPTTLGSLKDLI